MPAVRSMQILAEEVAAELAAQERRGDALDSKAGAVLGFAGVLVGLTVDRLHGWSAQVGTLFAGVAAVAAAVAFFPRSFPALSLRRLRDAYLGAAPDFTRLRIVDTRIAMYQQTEELLKAKARLVGGSALALCLAVVAIVIGAMV